MRAMAAPMIRRKIQSLRQTIEVLSSQASACKQAPSTTQPVLQSSAEVCTSIVVSEPVVVEVEVEVEVEVVVVEELEGFNHSSLRRFLC